MLTNGFLNEALKHKDVTHDLDLALKYAYLAASATYSPRADVCCVLGEIYLMKGNYIWAKNWYEKALYNETTGFDEKRPDQEFYGSIPMLKLGFILHNLGRNEEATDYFKAVLKIEPDNQTAKENLSLIQKEIEENTVEKK